MSHLNNKFRYYSYDLFTDIVDGVDSGYIIYALDNLIDCVLELVSKSNQEIKFFDYEHAYKDMKLEELLECWHEYTEKAIKDEDFIFFIRLVYYVLGLLPECDEYIKEDIKCHINYQSK